MEVSIKKNKVGMRTNRGFSLIELLITIVVLGILTSIAVPLYVNATNKANRSTAQANDRIGESMLTQTWMRIAGNGGDTYRDPEPPAGMSAPANADAEYMSRLETSTKFWRMRRASSRFGIAGIYKNGTLAPGTGTWSVRLYDWKPVYGMIGISYNTYWDPNARTWRSNTQDYAGAYPAKSYEQCMTMVVSPSGETLWTTYRKGSPIGSGSFRDPGWDDGRGRPE